MTKLFELVEVPEGYRLQDYAEFAYLAPKVAELEAIGRETVPRLSGRTIRIVSSTRQGGGVSEGLPRIVSLFRQLGVDVEWIVIHGPDPDFFVLTKRIHNQLHGVENSGLGPEARALYDKASEAIGAAIAGRFAPGDIMVVHDPQPLGAGARVKARVGVAAVWRCHIGIEEVTPAGDEAWAFLKADALAYDRCVFTLPGYAPPFLADRAVVMSPGIDPLSHKNRDLSVHKIAGILVNGALAATDHPSIAPPFAAPALRLQQGGGFAPAVLPEDIGLLFRPIVTQVSRWDRLKGFGPLIEAFVRLKQQPDPVRGRRGRRRIDQARLVLAGPDPAGVQDDPEAKATLGDLCGRWQALPPELRRDVAILALPMDSVKDNALMVNALQRCSTLVVQNSLREGFGLTVAEAMWKARPVMGTGACGIRAQVSDGKDGRLVADPLDVDAVAHTLGEMLADDKQREVWARNARDRVGRDGLVFREAGEWLKLLASVASRS